MMTDATWTPSADMPWRDDRLLAGALDLVTDVRVIPPAELVEALAAMDHVTMTHLLVATAALVPDDRSVRDLLQWATVPERCRRGHWLVGDNRMPNGLDRQGRPRVRCRTCYDFRVQQLRAAS